MLQDIYSSSLKFLTNAGKFIANAAVELVGPAGKAMAESAADKAKEFYQNHKEIVLSVSVATTVYLLMRKKEGKKEEVRNVAKKKEGLKKSVIKSFISEHSESEEEDPTMVTKQ